MNPRKWFLSKKLWLRGGMAGILVCILLFFFYIFLYFPIINHIYADDIASHGGTPAWTTNIPFFTGHLFPLAAGLTEGYPIVRLICKPEPICYSWTAESGCVGQSMNFSGACYDRAIELTALLFTLLLLAVYFVLGAAIGWILQKQKH